MTSDPHRRAFLKSAGALALMPPLFAVTSCENDEALRISGASMGTTWQVTVAGPSGDPDRQELKAAVERVLRRVDSRMSTWRADSELSRFNRAGPGIMMPVSAETANVAAAAIGASRLTGGAFDPTIGPAARLWGFGPGGSHDHMPSTAAVERALALTGYRHLRQVPGGLIKERGVLELDLSGIAKGYAVDRMSACLTARGLNDHLVELGGEIRTSGRAPGGAPWRIGVEQPAAGARAVHRVLSVGSAAMATSGDYRNFFSRDGERFSHVLDPRTGMPVRHGLASVTVIARTCMAADALSTALMVMGAEAGYDLAGRRGIAALFLVRRGGAVHETASPAFAARGFV